MLENWFTSQVEDRGVTFLDDDYRTECLNDFVLQYQGGEDRPKIRLNYPDRQVILRKEAVLDNFFDYFSYPCSQILRETLRNDGMKDEKEQQDFYFLNQERFQYSVFLAVYNTLKEILIKRKKIRNALQCKTVHPRPPRPQEHD